MRKDRGRLDTIPGYLPPIGADLPGCVFADRCALAEDVCRSEKPPSFPVGNGHTAAASSTSARRSCRAPWPPISRARASSTGRVPPLLDVADLTKIFSQGGGSVHALAGVSSVIWPGETLGLVGESGCGKTTFARTLLGIVEATSGSVSLDGRVLAPTLAKRTSEDVRALQIVFQNPDSALNRRHTVRRILRRSLKRLAGITGADADERIRVLSEAVRLPDRAILQRPAQLSGGQKQRVAIARAFAGEPRLVVCDEPTSALDVSVQAAILNLLVELQAERKTAYLFISHDLGVVRYLSDRIAVLYLGRLMELGTAETVFNGPHHPYTEALLSAVPTIDGEQRERIRLAGDIPSAADPPSGCVFHTRCPRKIGAICETQEPPLAEVEPRTTCAATSRSRSSGSSSSRGPAALSPQTEHSARPATCGAGSRP